VTALRLGQRVGGEALTDSIPKTDLDDVAGISDVAVLLGAAPRVGLRADQLNEIHDFPMFAGAFPEGAHAYTRIGAFIRASATLTRV
jgi:hypothetical protein